MLVVLEEADIAMLLDGGMVVAGDGEDTVYIVMNEQPEGLTS